MINGGNEDVRVVFGAAMEGLEAGLAEGTAAVKTATTEITESIEGMTSGIEAALAPLIALTALFETFAFAKEAIDSTIELGVELEKLAQKTGVAVESLSALRGAAILSEISSEDLDRGFKKLAVSVQEVHTGSGKAAEAFKVMGIAVDDAHGKTKPMDELLLEIADKFSGYEDGANKAALASDIFGARFGQVLIPFLDKGRAGIEDLKAKAEELGFTLTDKDVKAMDKAKAASNELTLATEGLKHAFGEALAGPLTEFDKWLTKVIAKMNQQQSLMGKIGALAMGMGGDKLLGNGGNDSAAANFKANFAAEQAGWAGAKTGAPQLADPKKAAEWKKAMEEITRWNDREIEKGDKARDKMVERAIDARGKDLGKKAREDFNTEMSLAKTLDAAKRQLNHDRSEGEKHMEEEAIARAKLIKQEWESMLSAIGSAMQNSVNGMIRGQMTLTQALRNLSRQALMNFMADKQRELVVHIATERAKEGATAASVFKKVALETWAAIQTAAVWAATAIKTIAMDAARGAAAAWASISAIPVVGPFLAPAAAAAALAGIMAMAHNVKSAAGGYDIPSGVNPMVQAHASEMILPAHLADGIRAMVDRGGGGGNGGGNHYHIHAIDAESFRDFADRHQDTFYDAVNTAAHGRRGRG